MAHFLKQKYKFWALGIAVAMVFMLISNIFKAPDLSNQVTITVNAPENMHSAFELTLSRLKMEKDYRVQFTNDSTTANFVVTEGSNASGELIAYSPFVAVFNSDEDLYEKMVNEEIFVPSQVDSDWDDFDFKKIMDQILSTSGSNIKVYYPSKDSAYWDEFYSFLLFTANDGYYPKEGSNMERVQKVVDDFLSSKNAEPISSASLKRINSVPQNSIYFITYADLAYLYQTSGISNIIVMYPKTVVYHSYYMTYDEIGKVLYDCLSTPLSTFSHSYSNTGYEMLYYYGYFNTKFTSGTSRFSHANYNDIKKRDLYNGVEIPDVTVNNDSNKEDK